MTSILRVIDVDGNEIGILKCFLAEELNLPNQIKCVIAGGLSYF